MTTLLEHDYEYHARLARLRRDPHGELPQDNNDREGLPVSEIGCQSLEDTAKPFPAQPAPDLLAVLDDEGLIAKVVCKFDAPRIAREAICAYRAALWERVNQKEKVWKLQQNG